MNKTNIWNIIHNTLLFRTSEFFLVLTFLIFLFLTSLVSYNLFHILIELFCIIIAFGIFIVAWNARSFFSNHFLLFLSIGYLFVSLIDITHTLAYKGIEVFAFIDPTSNLATQLWISARYMQAFFLLIAPLYLTRKMNINLVFQVSFLTILVIFVSIFYLKIFPTAYIDGIGLTTFKKISEYVISLILVMSAVYLSTKRKNLDRKIYIYIITSIIFTIASELAFTTYLGVYDYSNMLGHFFKIISFILMYKIIVETGVKNPLAYIFRNMEQSTEIIKSSELKFRSLVEIAPSAVISTNSLGMITLWNESAEKKFGWKSNEVIGKSLNLISPKENTKSNKFNIGQIIKERDRSTLNKTVESLGLRKNGEIFPLEVSSSSWVINNEEFFCYIIRDISERKKVEKELAKEKRKLESLVGDLKIFKLAMDNAFAHIVIANKNGIIVYANKSTEEITGYSENEIIGKTPALWGKQMPSSFYEKFWKTIKEDKKTYTGEITNKRKEGELYEAEIRVSPVLGNDGEVEYFVALERDITQEKEIDKAKTEFISLAAHQLKTPLTTISLASEILLRGIDGGMSKENKKYLKSIFGEIKDMTKMIEIFLNVSRIEMGKFPIETEEVGLFSVIEETVNKLLPQMKEKNLIFKKNYKNNLPILNLDKKVMNIILENLLSNAIKYSMDRGKIQLEVEDTHKNIIIHVSDNGIGIPESEHYRIFTKMFRAKNVFQIKSEGSGLGLYLVKNLAEQSGYSVSFISKENDGTTFSISIPKKTEVQKKYVDISSKS